VTFACTKIKFRAVFVIRTCVETKDVTKSFNHETSNTWDNFYERVTDLLEDPHAMLAYKISTKDMKRTPPHVLRSVFDYKSAMESVANACISARKREVELLVYNTVREAHS
jgi:hypothetical protein